MSDQPEEKDTRQEERTFTQEEVNRIVQDRLARFKAEPNDREKELEQKEKDLEIRERKLKAIEVFTEKSLPKELLEVLDYSDENKMNEHIKILEKTYRTKQGNYQPVGGGNPPSNDPVREAMGLK